MRVEQGVAKARCLLCPLGGDAGELALLFAPEQLYRKLRSLRESLCHRITHKHPSHSNVPFPFWEIRKYHMF